jgi:integrase
MSNYGVIYKNESYVIVDYDNNRKQVPGLKFSNKKVANRELKQLIAKRIIVPTNRFKFKKEWLAYADWRGKLACTPVRLTKNGVSGYQSNWNKYISQCFPDVYLDELNNLHIIDFIKCCYKLPEPATYKTAKRMVRNIKTFLNRMILENKIAHSPVLAFKIHECYEVQPEDDDLFYRTETPTINKDQVRMIYDVLKKNKDKDHSAAIKFAVITAFIFLGLRRSELQGLRKCDLDLENRLVKVQGMFDYRGEGWRNRTKNRGSKRSIELDDRMFNFFSSWKKYLDRVKPHSNMLFPATRGTDPKAPLSIKYIREMIWEVFEEMGLAKLERKKGHLVVISSPFKNAVTKTFRHFVASALVENMTTLGLSKNEVMKRVGHTRWMTTESIYGNKTVASKEDKQKRLAAVSEALKF